MLDDTGPGQFSSDEADAITANCDPNIIPIFPVRYALTADALTSFTRSCPNVATPSGLGGGLHDLRRLRRGYVYIYAASGHHEDMQSDTAGSWHVFRYETLSQDGNSETVRSDTQTGMPGSYSFTPYIWSDGTPSSEWEALTSRRFPYAYVHRDVSDVYIAYSEERWPAWFFERMGKDGSLRDKLMTLVNLTAESTAHSAKLSDIADHVTGFGGGAADPVENAIRQTALQPEEPSRVVNCPNARDNGRLVAVMDPLGEILDLGRLHEVLAQSQRAYAATYQYPLTIGAAVERHKSEMDRLYDESWNPWANHTVSPTFDTIYRALYNDQQSITRSIKSVVDGVMKIINRSGPGGLMEEHTLAYEGLSGIDDLSQFERAEYGAYVMGRALDPLSASPQGSRQLSLVVDPNTTSGSSLVDRAFQTTMEAYMKFNFDGISTVSRALRAPHFDVLVKATATEIAMHWVRTPNQTAVKLAVQRVGGFVQSAPIGVPVEDLDGFLRSSIRRLGFPDVPAQGAFLDGSRITVTADVGPVARANTIQVPGFSAGSAQAAAGQLDAIITPSAGTVQQLELERLGQSAGQGIGIVVSLAIIFGASQSWDQQRFTVSGVGAFAYDPKVIMGAAALDLFAATTAFVQLRNGATLTNGVTSQLFGRLFQGSRFLTPGAVTAQVTTAATGTASRVAISVVGRAAGAVGVILAGFVAYEAFRVGDANAMIGNSLIAIGGLIMLVAGATLVGAIIGAVLIVIGIIISLFSYTPMQSWVATSFWGSSNAYWERNRPANIDMQIQAATALANPGAAGHRDMKDFFEDEVMRYTQLVSQPRLVNGVQGDYAIEVAYLPVTDAGALDDMDINIRMYFLDDRSNMSTHQIYSSHSNRVIISFVSPGVFRMQIRQSALDIINRVFPVGSVHELTTVKIRGSVDGKDLQEQTFQWPL